MIVSRLVLFLTLFFVFPCSLRCQCVVKDVLPGSLNWISTIVAGRDSDHLLIADPTATGLFEYSFEQDRFARIPLQCDVMNVTRIDQGYFVECNNNQALILDPGLVPLQKIRMGEVSSGRGRPVGSLYTGWASNTHFFLGAGTMGSYPPSSSNEASFIFGEIDLSKGFMNVTRRLDWPQLKSVDYYMAGLVYFAAVNGDMFFVDMQYPKATLWKVRVSPHPSLCPLRDAIPPEFERVAMPVQAPSIHPAAQKINPLADLKLVAGLYSYKSNLLLLVREPSAEGTLWALFLIDPNSGKTMGKIILPTFVPHINIVPNGEYLYIVEKSEVDRGVGTQTISNIKRVQFPPAISRSTLTTLSCQ